MQSILVLCTGNSCRSQMAEGYLKLFAATQANIFSAGIKAHGVNLRAVDIMKEDGIDISNQTSNTVDDFRGKDFDFIITVCDNAKENCPVFPSRSKRFHHYFPDPAIATGSDAEIQNEFRRARDMIKAYCRSFVEENI
ncbi:MAG: arsenate reductase ArsC [Saprospiraceae bacterium]